MAAPQSTFGGTLNSGGKPVIGWGSSSIGSSLFVLHKQANTATTGPDDPTAVMAGATAAEHCIPVAVPNAYYWLHMYVMWTGVANMTTPPTVYAYGRVPPWSSFPSVAKSDEIRNWPEDWNAATFGTPGASLAAGRTEDLQDGLWIPLVEDTITWPIAMDDGTTLRMEDTGHTTDWSMSAPTTLYIAGCTHVLTAIGTAANPAAMIVGRFVG
jgi:hypothetical protein